MTYYQSMASQQNNIDPFDSFQSPDAFGVWDRDALTANSKPDLYGKSVVNELKAIEKILSEDKDMVNHPDHYTCGGMEAIDVIQAKLTDEQFLGYCVANALKYLMRQNYKGKQQEDIKKASWYLSRLVDSFGCDD